MATKKRELDQSHKDEAAALRLLIAQFNEGKPKGQKIPGARVADDLGISSAGYNFYVRGVNPLNIKFAPKISKIFGFPIFSFSPRLAEELSLMVDAIGIERKTGFQAAAPNAQHTPQVVPAPVTPHQLDITHPWASLSEKLQQLSYIPAMRFPELVEKIEADRLKIEKPSKNKIAD